MRSCRRRSMRRRVLSLRPRPRLKKKKLRHLRHLVREDLQFLQAGLQSPLGSVDLLSILLLLLLVRPLVVVRMIQSRL